MSCETTRWPEGLTVELYAFGSEPRRDEVAETPSVLAWHRAQEVFADSNVRLCYASIDADLEYAYWMSMWKFPAFRVVLKGREIGRTNAVFASAEKLEEWMRDIILRA